LHKLDIIDHIVFFAGCEEFLALHILILERIEQKGVSAICKVVEYRINGHFAIDRLEIFLNGTGRKNLAVVEKNILDQPVKQFYVTDLMATDYVLKDDRIVHIAKVHHRSFVLIIKLV
jgi:hypothetical protein